MRPSNPYEPDTEERLREENRLKRQPGLDAPEGLRPRALADTSSPERLASLRLTIWAIVLGALVLIVVAFFAGYIPLQKRRT